jgi:circadian clock protein KaiB
MQIKEGEMKSKIEVVSLKLYIASGTPNSVLAMNNLLAILDEYLADGHSLEVIDVLKDPKRAIVDGVLVTPMLVRVSPLPKVSIIGNLGDKEKVLYALNLGGVPN